MFAPPALHIDDSGAEGAELEADLEEELPDATEDAESAERTQTGIAQLEFEPKPIAFEDAKVRASERAAHDEEPSH